MKKFVIVGSGSAGLIAAGMIKTYWKDGVDITVIHDKSQGSIAVGESTTPYICLLYTSPSPRDDISSRMPSSA